MKPAKFLILVKIFPCVAFKGTKRKDLSELQG
jgi:hypothetical protein